MRMAAKYAVKRRSQVKSFAAPIGGWIANRNLAQPNPTINGGSASPGAFVLENFFPTSRGAKMRRGSELYATLGVGNLPAESMFTYVVGAHAELFAATETTIYNISTIIPSSNYTLVTDLDDYIVTDLDDYIADNSTIGLEVAEDQHGGDWISVQFATGGGIYLALVNGIDDMLIYDGANWAPINDQQLNKIDYDDKVGDFTEGQVITGGTSGATATIVKVVDQGDGTGSLWLRTVTGGPFQNNEGITDPITGAALVDGTISVLWGAFTGIETSKLSYVWAFKNRLFFVEKGTLSAWYLPVDSMTGVASEIPLGGVFNKGGALLFGASWSLDSGSGGSGLSEQCIFVTTEGEVAVFQGNNPGDPDSWQQVNTYRIGRPLGKRAHIRAGGDVVIATSIGLVPLSQAIQRDYAALSPSAVSYPIEDAWNEAVETRSSEEWNCEVWPSAQMVIVAPPTINEQPAVWYVANARTGAWAPFTQWDATCLAVFQERCFFGSQDGKIIEANVTGLDQGATYTSVCVPLFDDLRTPAALKLAKMIRPIIRSAFAVNEQVSMQTDFSLNLPSSPDASAVPSLSVWGGGIWGESTWGVAGPINTYQNWRVTMGSGYAVAPSLQITSGAIVPLDCEIVRIDLAFELTDQIA